MIKFPIHFGSLLAAGAFLVSTGLSAVPQDFGGCSLQKDEKRSNYWIKDANKKGLGGIGVEPKSEFPNFKIAAENDALIIDTRDMYKSLVPKRSAILRLNLIDAAKAYKAPAYQKHEKTNRMSFEIKSDAPGVIVLFFEGLQKVNGKNKHYWTAKNVMLNGQWQTVSFDRVFPENLEKAWMRIDIRKPIRIAIRKASFEQVPLAVKKFDPNKNHILNGGAERGWTGLSYNSLKNFQNAATGKYLPRGGREISKEVKVFLDPETKYEGAYSFRLEKEPGAVHPRPFVFNPIPYIAGESASLTFYAKAEKPLEIECGLFLGSGQAVASTFTVGTEWKKYELYMPSWGKKGKGFNVIGDIVKAYSTETGVVQPSICIRGAGKLWIDNVAYSIGGHAVYREKDSFFITHKLSKDSSYYFNDEKINAELSFRNASKKEFKGSASYEIQDVFGKTVFTKEIGKVTVPADQSVKQSITLQVPQELRGPFHVVFKAKSGKNVYSDVAYAGIIDRGGDLNKRIGVNAGDEYNFKIAAEYLRDFRIGSVRLWFYGPFRNKPVFHGTDAELLKKKGFDIMLATVGLRKAAYTDPVRWKSEMEVYDKLFGKYGKYIDIIESQNEANIVSFASTDSVRKELRDFAGFIKKHGLKCKLAGPTTCTLDFSWTSAVLASPEGKLVDIVTEHPYQTLPELPDYMEASLTMRKIIDMHKPEILHYATEAGRVQPYMPEKDGFVSKYTVTAAARDIRNIIQGFSGGVERYYHFAFSLTPEGTSWNNLYTGTRGNNGVPRPNPCFYALRTLSDRLEQAKCVRLIELGVDYRCPVFDHGKKRTAVIWKWNGKPGTFTFKPEDAKQFAAYNLFGTKISSGKLEMNEFPIYLDTALSAEETEKAIRRGTLAAEGTSLFEVGSVILGKNRFAVEVQNRTGNTLENIKVSIDTPNAVSGSLVKTIASIGPVAKKRAEFELKKPISTKDFNVKVSVSDPKSKTGKTTAQNLRAVLVQKTAKPLVIDGDLSDWPKSAAVVKLDQRNAVKIPKAKWGANEDKVHAELRYAWDDNFLYTAVTVYKPEFYPSKDMRNIRTAWRQDSLQICYDTLRNAKPGTTGIKDDDFEYTLVQCGNDPVVERKWASTAIHDSLDKALGIVSKDEIPFAVKQYADRVVYEMAFSKRSVSPFKLKPYSVMRTGLIVNINNGKERAGWLELTPGVGQAPKRPDQWMDMVLLP